MKSQLTAGIRVVLGLAAAAYWCASAQATTFTFNDEYYISSLTRFHSVFGNSTNGYTSPGIYQLTNSATPIVTRIGNGSSVPLEYVEDTSPNANQALKLFGWTQSLNNGQQVASVYNSQNPSVALTYFQFAVGGVNMPFTFNAFDLRGSTAAANLSFTLQGFLGSTLVNSTVLNVTGNGLATFTENWINVDRVQIQSTASLPVNWSSGVLYMDNVQINEPVGSTSSAAPEPATLMLLGSSLAGLGALKRKSAKP